MRINEDMKSATQNTKNGENKMNALANANRALSLYADTVTDDKVTISILDLLSEVEMGASDDGLDEDEAEEAARNAAILSVASSFQAAGLMDVYHTLLRALR